MSTKKTTEVATVTTVEVVIPKTTKDVPAAIAQLEAELKALKGQVEDKISLDIQFEGTRIKDVTTVRELMEISSSMKKRSEAYEEAIFRHNLQDKNIAKFTISEKNVDEWMKIIDKAVFELINKSQITKIEAAIKKLSNHLDAETKLAKELNEIMQSAVQEIK